MRVLHVVPTYFPAVRYGGPIHSVHGLCAALAARGHDVHVFTTSVDGPGDSAVPLCRPVDMDGVKVWYFPSRWLRRLYWSPLMARMLKKEVGSFDLVHLHSVFLWPTWAAARAARRFRVHYVVSPRGMLVEDLVRRKSQWLKKAWIRLVERHNIATAAAIHVTSETEARELSRFALTMPRVITIPNGISLPGVAASGTISGDVEVLLAHRLLILFLGRIHWKKGLDRLIPALTAVPEIGRAHV
jgi:glycosyltransferase involved in cell wall biosynthesis